MRQKSELLGTQQRVDEVDHEPHSDEGGERVVEDHGALPLELVASVGVADRQREKAEPDGQHDQVKHLNAPSDTQFRAVRRWTGLMRIKSLQKVCALFDRLSSADIGICFLDGNHGDVIGISYRRVATPAHRSGDAQLLPGP